MIRKALPSFVTSLGLMAGCVSIVYSSAGNLYLAGIMILVASLFDFLDGFLARLLDCISEFGKQLDSLADVISFGVAPAMIIKALMEISLAGGTQKPTIDTHPVYFSDMVFLYSPFIIAVFSALRLARFNLDSDQTSSFKGLATPANAIWIAGLGFIHESGRHLLSEEWLSNSWFLLAFVAVSCTLLVSGIPMFSLKFKTYSIHENFIRYVFVVISFVLLLWLGLTALSLIIIMYIVFSLLNNWVFKMT